MNEWQALRQIRYKARNATWTGASSLVWGRQVVVTVSPEESVLANMNTPILLIRPGSGRVDPELTTAAGFTKGQVLIRSVVSIPGDAWGEHAVLGANRVVETASGGKGLLEVQEELFATIRLLNEEDGLRIQLAAADVIQANPSSRMGYVAWRDYLFNLSTDYAKAYPPATSFRVTSSTGGNAALAWTSAPDRFDWYQTHIRRAAGATPPASVTAGTQVLATTTRTTQTHTDSPGVGQFSYSIFQEYDERDDPPDSADISSVADTVTTTVTT